MPSGSCWQMSKKYNGLLFHHLKVKQNIHFLQCSLRIITKYKRLKKFRNMYQVYLLIKNLFHFKLYVQVGGRLCTWIAVFCFFLLIFLRESLLHSCTPNISDPESRRACDLLVLESHLCEPLDTGDNQTLVPGNSTMCSKPLNDFSRPS